MSEVHMHINDWCVQYIPSTGNGQEIERDEPII